MRFIFRFVFSLIILSLISCSSNKEIRITQNFNGERFHNLEDDAQKSLLSVIKWKMTSTVESWSDYPETPFAITTPEEKIDTGVKITFIGHATFLIQMNGLNILTDPVWAERASPVSFLGPKRHTSLPISLENLPKIDVILISHNHYDHMDKDTLSYLSKRDDPLVIVPLENKRIVEKFGVRNIVELDWWDSFIIDEEIEITMLPSRHWSRRTLTDTNKSLWGSFHINGDKNIYFGGDTGFGKHFQLIKNKFQNIDVALLPIGAYAPRWFMKEAHMNPEDAIEAHNILKPKLSIGMHFGTFQLTDEGPLKPKTELEKICNENSITNFVAPTIGEEFSIK